jgi:hypothetical protein
MRVRRKDVVATTAASVDVGDGSCYLLMDG